MDIGQYRDYNTLEEIINEVERDNGFRLDHSIVKSMLWQMMSGKG